MTNQMKSVIRENIHLIDDNNFDEFYKKVTDSTHAYADVAEVTIFLMDMCNVDPMPHLTIIPWAYLYHCQTVNEVNIPEGVVSIGIGAYLGSSIHKVTLPKSCTEVCAQAFSRCDRLTDIRIENPDIIIDSLAFAHTHGIDWIMYNGTIEQFTSKEWPDKMIDDSYVVCLDGTIHMGYGVARK